MKPVKSPVSKRHTRRCRFMSLTVAVTAIGMTARAAQIQLLQADRWRQKSEIQTETHDTLPAARGGVFDRHGRPLAVSLEAFDAFFAAAESDDREGAVEQIAAIVDLDSRSERRLRAATGGWTSIGRVDGRIRALLEETIGSGVHFTPVVTRAYPEGDLARTLLGSVNENGRGRSGLELLFDSLLVGTEGRAVWKVDARGERYPVPEAGRSLPRPGRDVYLTIDLELQAIAEQALERALAETGSSGGDVLMVDPRTGELLAVASRRGDRNFGIPAFTDPYEPGSTVKPFLIATLLEEELATLDDRVDVENGEWRTAHRTIRDVHGYDSLSVAEVLLHSSNIGAAKLAARLDRGLQYAYLRDFGFGTPTGVRVPSESAGLLRRPGEWSAVSQASLAFGYEILTTSLQLAVAYGALANGGILMRPSLIREVRSPEGEATWRSEPEAVRRVIREDVADQVTRVLTWVVSEEGTGHRAALQTIPIAGKTGTARIASNGGYAERRYAASFVGFAPADDPKLVILTKLEDPKGQYYGGGIAAPVSRGVLQAMLAGEDAGLLDDTRETAGSASFAASGILGLNWLRPGDSAAPQGDHGARDRRSPSGASSPSVFRFATNGGGNGARHVPGFADERESDDVIVPDVVGMDLRAAVGRLYRVGLDVELYGSGEVVEQIPAPGTKAVRGASVILR
ncbi:MAG: penicillin-binding transpeptidase domain-containing protein [marine benthic group bacterium]|nr:penicillin-binding transpeptidase domain-containing protein [Gemmatimonadota bacterium]MCL7962751.1 penicillin-binding transpeptidase domain-containing protein [Candidatus Carthagonibacter metallireducens]MCL7937175.1 penicillin-binding transpeptidase domain-containing protein [Gemmatimonadota bacterium]MCL7969182.1 penicillin-binding transpeptidase domain-containing protein [Gemmatimonadota bacterium]MCL7977082.1 penicillin-binding transpeptidase domain-containing protein [Gemmatimonadota b